jgi:hypothetical protein
VAQAAGRDAVLDQGTREDRYDCLLMIMFSDLCQRNGRVFRAYPPGSSRPHGGRRINFERMLIPFYAVVISAFGALHNVLPCRVWWQDAGRGRAVNLCTRLAGLDTACSYAAFAITARDLVRGFVGQGLTVLVGGIWAAVFVS